MRKLLLLAFSALPSLSYGAFTTDWLRNTTSTITIRGTTYYWQAGSGSNGQALKTDGNNPPTLTFGDVSTSISTMTVGASTYFIFNQNTLQEGATFFVSSGTVNGQFRIYNAASFGDNAIVNSVRSNASGPELFLITNSLTSPSQTITMLNNRTVEDYLDSGYGIGGSIGYDSSNGFIVTVATVSDGSTFTSPTRMRILRSGNKSFDFLEPDSPNKSWLSMNASTATFLTPVHVHNQVASSVPLIVVGTVSQTGNLQTWHSTGTAITYSLINNMGIPAFFGNNASGTQTNTVIGFEAGKDQVVHTSFAKQNTFVGYQAGKSLAFNDLSTFIGYQAAINANGGNQNTVIGASAGSSLTSGNANTFIGYNAGNQITTGSNNVVIGPDTFIFGNPSGTVVIGAGIITSPSNTASFIAANASGDTSDFLLWGYPSTGLLAKVYLMETAWIDSADATKTSRAAMNVFYQTTAQEGMRVDASSIQARVAFGGAIPQSTKHTVYIGSNTDVGSVVRMAPTQIGNPWELQLSSGVAVSTFSPNGTIYVSSANLTTSSLRGGQTRGQFLTTQDDGMLVLSTAASITSGTYGPTPSSATNLDGAVSTTTAQYMRVGNVVTVSGRFTADPTLTATVTSFELTLPIPSNFAAVEDAAGGGVTGSVGNYGAEITAVVANDTIKMQWVSIDVDSQSWSYIYTYSIK